MTAGVICFVAVRSAGLSESMSPSRGARKPCESGQQFVSHSSGGRFCDFAFVLTRVETILAGLACASIGC